MTDQNQYQPYQENGFINPANSIQEDLLKDIIEPAESELLPSGQGYEGNWLDRFAFNPWDQSTLLDTIAEGMRFSLWAMFKTCALMGGVFCMFFTYEFLMHFWNWLERTIFSGPW